MSDIEKKKLENEEHNYDGASVMDNEGVEDEAASMQADLDAVMRKYDRESNTRIWTGKYKLCIDLIMAAFSLYCILSTLLSKAQLEQRLMIFLGFVVVIGFLTYPVSKHHVRPNNLPWYDIIIMVIGAACFFYCAAENEMLMNTITSGSKVTPFFAVIGILGILTYVELCRRCVGIPILCVAGVLIIYTFASGVNVGRAIYNLFYATSGIMSTPIQVCAKYIVVFVIFGAFLERTGIAAFFIDLANSLAGASSGGPAKVAVISSALCGMVSGSSVGNTVTTGSVTIPMMKKTGYAPEFAGAVEAAASTGGQIMPPIMGAAAFLMAEYVGEPYGKIALRAILPAVLYFLGIFIAVHLEAKKLGLKGIPRDQLPKFGILIRKIYLLAPLVVLVWLVSTNTRTMQFSASVAIIVTIVVSLFDKAHRITPKKFMDALAAGGRGVITVAAACSIAGIIAGCITVTGLASKLIGGIVALSGGIPIIGMLLTMVCCIILGMGVPTTANYCIMATTCAPILVQMGIPTVAAHFFVFYFGIVADLTPPVALAAYAGAAIAGANPMKTAFNATKLAIAAFIIPYILAYNPAMVLVDTTVVEVVMIAITSLIGMFGLGMALEGYYRGSIPWYLRILSAAGGLCLVDPGTVTDVIGIVVVGAIVVMQILRAKKTLKAA